MKKQTTDNTTQDTTTSDVSEAIGMVKTNTALACFNYMLIRYIEDLANGSATDMDWHIVGMWDIHDRLSK